LTTTVHNGQEKRVARLACAAWLALWCVGAAAAPQADADARYRSERAACAQIEEGESRANCLRDAAAAHNAAQRGELDEEQAAYAKNALARCDALPPADQDSCRRRTRGEGETHGSVGSGGVLREYRELTLPSVTNP